MFWWSNLGWPVWAVVLTVAVLAVVVFSLRRRGSMFLALMVLAVLTLILRMGFAVRIWDWLEWLALILWVCGIVATVVYLATSRALGLAWTSSVAAFGLVAAFDVWQFVLVPLWYWVSGWHWGWLGRDRHWLWVLFVVLVIAAVVFLIRHLPVLALIAGVLAVVLLVAGAWNMMFPPHKEFEAGKQPSASPTATPTAQPSNQPATFTGCDTWKISTKTPKNGDWVNHGVKEIQNAKTKAQARHGVMVWLDKAKQSTGTLQGAAAYLLHKNVDRSALRDEHGCATQRADELVQEIGVAFSLANIRPAMAPAGARNSFTRGGHVVASNQTGIRGNRKSAEVTLMNGKVVNIMAICGNLATTGKPPVKTGTPPKRFAPTKHHGGHHHVCPVPKYVPASMWNYSTCHKKDSSFGYGQNTGQQAQPAHENNSGAYTGPPSGTSSAPTNTQVHSGDTNTTSKGSNSGSTTGSGTAAGSTCDSSGCTSSSTSGSGDGGSGTGTTSGDTNDGSVDPFSP